MTAFNKGNKRFGGKPRFHGPPERSGGFNKNWGDKRSDDRQTTMHQATCANCGKPCEVPFRPVQGKPVYCKDCFSTIGAPSSGGFTPRDRYPKKEFRPREERGPRAFTPRESVRPATENGRGNEEIRRGNEDIKKQLQTMNIKMDRMIQVLEKISLGAAPRNAEPKVSTAKPAKAPKKAATATKKVAKKKGKK